MNEQMQQQIMARLDAISQKLGIAAGVLWNATVRQELVNAWECVIGALLFAAAGLLIGITAWKYRKELQELSIFAALAVLACVAFFIVCAFNAVDLFSNPTFWAFKDLLEAIK